MGSWRSLLVLVIAVTVQAVAIAQSPTYNLGRTPTAEELTALDISIRPDGKGLPPGSGTAPTLDWLGFRAEGAALGELCEKNPESPGLLTIHDDKAHCSQTDDKYLIVRAQEVNPQTGEPAAPPGSPLITNYPDIAGKLRPTG